MIAGELLEIVLLYRLNDRSLPTDIETAIRRMVEFEVAATRPDGQLPLFGDSSQTDSYARFSALRAGRALFPLDGAGADSAEADEAELWRLARIEVADRSPGHAADASRAFPSGGYYLMRSGATANEAMYCCIDCGPFGLTADPHHGHADALSFELFAFEQPWLVDSGVYSTHAPWEWRRYFRGTRSHNTVSVDGEDQTVLLDSRRVLRQAESRCHRWRAGAAIDHFDGGHDGYSRLQAPAHHRRLVWFVKGEYWLIVDVITGTGQHDLEVLFHAPEDVAVEPRPGAPIAHFRAGSSRSLLLTYAASCPVTAAVAKGSTSPIQGWRSNHSGEKHEAATLVLGSRSALPAMSATAIFPGAPNGAAPSLDFLPVNTADGSVVAASVAIGDQRDYFLSRNTASGKSLPLGPFATNAELAVVRESGNTSPVVLHCEGGDVTPRESDASREDTP